MLFDLCSTEGVSGREWPIAKKALGYLSKYMECRIDALGSVVGKTDGSQPRILLDAHIDRIGLVVTAIDSTGFLKVAKCGGADIRVMAASEVTVWGKEPLFGVVTSVPPHLAKSGKSSKAADFDELCIDIGMSCEQAKELVSPGDTITFNGTQARLISNEVVSPCIDNRAGIAAILRCLEIIEESREETCALTVLFSVQEETGGSGALVGGFASEAQESIVVDVGFGRAPGIRNDQAGELGGGTMIGYAPSLDTVMSQSLTELAQGYDIKWQYDVMGGKTGTNGDGIQTSASGIRTALLSIPIRNMHTVVETVCLDDIEATAQLMANYILGRRG